VELRHLEQDWLVLGPGQVSISVLDSVQYGTKG
jgi:hypothetical protein